MLSCSQRNRFWSMLLVVYFAGVGLIGFSGIAWCLDWSTDKGDHIELANSHMEMSDFRYIPFLNCVATEPSKTTKCATCLDINTQSISGWRTDDDRLTSSVSILPDRTSAAFLQLSALKSFAGKSLPAVLASKLSLSLESIQTKFLRSVVLLI